MTDDQKKAKAALWRLLQDIATPETDKLLHAYVGDVAQMTPEGLAWHVPAESPDEAITHLVGSKTYGH